MTALAGKDFLLKAGDGAGPEVFSTIGGIRSKSLKINSESIDVTSEDSAQWREILDGAGITSMSVSGSGIFTDSTAARLVRTNCIGRTLMNFELIDGGGTKFAGKFKVTSFETAGEYKGEQTYAISLESSGAVTVTPGA